MVGEEQVVTISFLPFLSCDDDDDGDDDDERERERESHNTALVIVVYTTFIIKVIINEYERTN